MFGASSRHPPLSLTLSWLTPKSCVSDVKPTPPIVAAVEAEPRIAAPARADVSPDGCGSRALHEELNVGLIKSIERVAHSTAFTITTTPERSRMASTSTPARVGFG